MKNIFLENKKLIGDIARKYGCTLDVAKDRLKADLLSGGDSQTGGLIPADLHAEADAIGPDAIRQMNSEYFEAAKGNFGEPYDVKDYQ